MAAFARVTRTLVMDPIQTIVLTMVSAMGTTAAAKLIRAVIAIVHKAGREILNSNYAVIEPSRSFLPAVAHQN